MGERRTMIERDIDDESGGAWKPEAVFSPSRGRKDSGGCMVAVPMR
jgi:hypothetical protein